MTATKRFQPAHCGTCHRWATPVFATALLVLVGCGQNENVGRVTGVVRLDGEPLTKGTVRFVPEAGRAAEGEIQPDGSFTLGTFSDSDGALVGMHRVAIVAFDREPVQRTAAGPPPPSRSKPLVPQKYLAHGSSGITREVKPGSNYFEIDLSSQ